jgi:uncharacterized membrane protein YkvA (DUF1232 family)
MPAKGPELRSGFCYKPLIHLYCFPKPPVPAQWRVSRRGKEGRTVAYKKKVADMARTALTSRRGARALHAKAMAKAKASGLIEGFLENLIRVGKVLVDPKTPRWAKLAAAGALAYFILPIDLIPDYLPGGFLDDAAVAAGVVTLLIRKGILTR